MAKATFVCTQKTGVETFTVHLEPVTHVLETLSPEDYLREAGVPEHAIKAALVTHANTLLQGVVLHPHADKSFFAGFPYGSIVLSALTPEAGAEFEEGQETIVEFTFAGRRRQAPLPLPTQEPDKGVED